MKEYKTEKVHFHLPGLYEFHELYRLFLPLYKKHPEFFYDWCDIGSIYGSPPECVWSGGRIECGKDNTGEVLSLLEEYGISARLTFSNSLLEEKHLLDMRCNELCRKFQNSNNVQKGIIVHSDLLLEYLRKNYPEFYFVSSTTKVIADFSEFKKELEREEFKYVVPDFRLNKHYDELQLLSQNQKDKVEFLCNECCWTFCKDRKLCYENVSRKNLGEDCKDFVCKAPGGNNGYVFSKAMKKDEFIGTDDILNFYIKNGFSNFKIEGRGLGSAMILEFLLYYMTKKEHQLEVRENIYLDSMLDLF